jgi:hypothetical protein
MGMTAGAVARQLRLIKWQMRMNRHVVIPLAMARAVARLYADLPQIACA